MLLCIVDCVRKIQKNFEKKIVYVMPRILKNFAHGCERLIQNTVSEIAHIEKHTGNASMRLVEFGNLSTAKKDVLNLALGMHRIARRHGHIDVITRRLSVKNAVSLNAVAMLKNLMFIVLSAIEDEQQNSAFEEILGKSGVLCKRNMAIVAFAVEEKVV